MSRTIAGIGFRTAHTGTGDVLMVCERCGAVVLPAYVHDGKRPTLEPTQVHAEWHHSNDHNLEGLG